MKTNAALLAVVGCALGAGPASAHAFLKTASPPVGSSVRTAPTEVDITFTEGVEPRFSSIAVQDQSDASVTAGEVHRKGDDTQLAVALKPLTPGTYKVIWHATSVDTHKTQGDYDFAVKP